MRKHWNTEKNMINTESLNWNHRRRKRTKNDELEALLASSCEPPGRTLKEKNEETSHQQKGYLIKKSGSLKKEGGRAGKTKTTWGWMKQTTLRRTDNWSCECWSDRIHLKRNTPVEKGLTWQSRLSWRIGIHIGVWEHRLGKIWNQHLTLKQLEYHNSKQKQRIGLQNKLKTNMW